MEGEFEDKLKKFLKKYGILFRYYFSRSHAIEYVDVSDGTRPRQNIS
jgi:hypothetical protein